MMSNIKTTHLAKDSLKYFPFGGLLGIVPSSGSIVPGVRSLKVSVKHLSPPERKIRGMFV